MYIYIHVYIIFIHVLRFGAARNHQAVAVQWFDAEVAVQLGQGWQCS